MSEERPSMAGQTNTKAAPAAKHDPETGEVHESADKAAAKTGSTDVATVDADYDYGADAGAGFENQTGEDISIPFLTVLQPGSPEVQADPEKPPFPGLIINKTTGQFYPRETGITFVPALTQHVLVEWSPRNEKGESTGGFIGLHAIDSDLARRVREEQPLGTYKHTANGNDLVETFYVYGLLVDDAGNGFPSVMSFSSTHIKPYKDWMYQARSIVVSRPDGTKITKLPLFSHGYQITGVKKEGGGNTWYVPVVRFAGGSAEKARISPRNPLYEQAKAMRDAVGSGRLKADTDSLSREGKVDARPERGDTGAEEAPY
jgi:hypothetical protein